MPTWIKPLLKTLKLVFSWGPDAAMNLVDCRPSAIAAAAILAASSDRLTKTLLKSKMSKISLLESLEAVSPFCSRFKSIWFLEILIIRENELLLSLCQDYVFSCYSMMIQESQKQKQKPEPSKLLISSDVSANTSVDLNNDTSISAMSNKRRRFQ